MNGSVCGSVGMAALLLATAASAEDLNRATPQTNSWARLRPLLEYLNNPELYKRVPELETIVAEICRGDIRVIFERSALSHRDGGHTDGRTITLYTGDSQGFLLVGLVHEGVHALGFVQTGILGTEEQAFRAQARFMVAAEHVNHDQLPSVFEATGRSPSEIASMSDGELSSLIERTWPQLYRGHQWIHYYWIAVHSLGIKEPMVSLSAGAAGAWATDTLISMFRGPAAFRAFKRFAAPIYVGLFLAKGFGEWMDDPPEALVESASFSIVTLVAFPVMTALRFASYTAGPVGWAAFEITALAFQLVAAHFLEPSVRRVIQNLHR